MVLLAMVNMLLLLLGFFIGLRKSKGAADAPATLHPSKKSEETATELLARESSGGRLIRPETNRAFDQLQLG